MHAAKTPMRIAQPGKQRPHPVELQIVGPRLPALVINAPVPEGERFVVGHCQRSEVRGQRSEVRGQKSQMPEVRIGPIGPMRAIPPALVF